jgi:glutathione S-transferase
MLKIFGEPRSRAYRCLWLARELGIEVENVPVAPDVGAKAAEHLAVNPNGKVPALIDGSLVMWESMAINLYLAKKFGGSLAPQTLEEEAAVLQWTFWVVNECEVAAIHVMQRKVPRPGYQPTEQEVLAGEETLRRVLPILDAALVGRPYLLGDRFTVADLNVASVVGSAKAGGFDFNPVPNVARWLSDCLKRPAQRESVRAMTAT